MDWIQYYVIDTEISLNLASLVLLRILTLFRLVRLSSSRSPIFCMKRRTKQSDRRRSSSIFEVCLSHITAIVATKAFASRSIVWCSYILISNTSAAPSCKWCWPRLGLVVATMALPITEKNDSAFLRCIHVIVNPPLSLPGQCHQRFIFPS